MSTAIEAVQAAKLAEVVKLTIALADRILDAQVFGLSVPSVQITALVRAARLLQDHGVPWPPLVEQVLHELANGAGKPAISKPVEASEGDGVVAGLTRFFDGFRRDKGLPA